MDGEKLFTQDELNTLIGDARIKARTKAEADFEAKRAKADELAEQANLAAKDEWQKLSATHQARVQELEPLEAQVKAYEGLIEGMLKDKVKELGDKAKKALPAAMTPLEQLAWLNDNVELFQEVTDPVVGTPRGGVKSAADAHRPRKKMRF